MLQEKEQFLKHEYIPLLRQLQAHQPGRWGKMDAQQMVEHMRDAFKVANGKIVLPLINTDPAVLEKARAFMLSEAPFRENTKMPLMPEEPRRHKYAGMEEAIEKLRPELEDVFTVYAADPQKVLVNPVFGDLNYEQQVHLLHKHAKHHLAQFGL
ncbi:MAG: hypothetical protein JO301_18200 [Chitinophagaceae bacterium]|nr:hypothetical protein [Chitinophagaceae bacterium]